MRLLATSSVLILLLISCSTHKNHEMTTVDKVVQFQFQIFTPHCGGAVISKEENGHFTPMPHRSFQLRNAHNTTTSMLKTDENGEMVLHLESGIYKFFDSEKMLDSAAFLRSKIRENEYYKSAPDNCYEEWRTTPDFEVAISVDTSFTLIEYQGCFTSNNPCIHYIGPMPP